MYKNRDEAREIVLSFLRTEARLSIEIAWDASAAEMEKALLGISTIDAVTVTAVSTAQMTTPPLSRYGTEWAQQLTDRRVARAAEHDDLHRPSRA